MPRVVLLRQLGFFSATALVVSNMVGAGIFATTGYMAGDLGSPQLILLAWAAGAVFAFCGALSYSELGINFPSSGGEYVYLTRAYGPAWGFISGWVSFFAGFSASIAAAALAFAHYLAYFIPAFREPFFVAGAGAFSIHIGFSELAASALIAAFTALNCFGLGRTARVQNVLTGTKLAVLAAFVLLGLLFGHGSFQHFSQHAVRTSATSLPVQFMISLLWVTFGYTGWNAATYVAEELRKPEATLPLALAAGTAIVATLYLALNFIFIYATPLEEMKNVLAVGSQAAANLFGPQVAGIFAVLMAVSITSTVNAMVTIGPRVYYAMAKNGAFFHRAAEVHPRFHTPVWAILAQGVCSVLMTLTPFPDLIVYIGFSLTLFTTLAVASIFLFRRGPSWQRLRALDFAFPLIPGAYVLAGAAMLVYGVVWQPRASLTALATMAAGAGAYRLTKRKAAA
jgi:APA family basic amino acid/polyamine antiporter